MPHGDFSDVTALALIASGVVAVGWPALCLADVPPLKPCFSVPELSIELEAMIRFCGSFLLLVGSMLFSVRWNTVNGKACGLGCIGCGANIAHVTFSRLDKEVFVFRPFYIHAVLLVLAGLHLMFNANPVIKVPKKD